ncbi:response regulator transcription factor [Paenibacillus tianjinensis]|nr:helix-turn-helix transcriptional regulator [Paenibacillus tianjinensis]
MNIKVGIPDSLMEEIQQLQDTFGAVMSQAIVLTDQEGDMITRPTITGKFYGEMLASLQGFERPFGPPLHRLGPFSHPTVLEEWIPGLKYVVSPLVSGYGQIYYLWSGLYMEQGAKEQVLELFGARMKHHPDYKQLHTELLAMPEYSQERIAEIREKLTVLSSLLSKLFAGWAVKPQEERTGMIMTRLLGNLEEDFLNIEAVLQMLAETAAGDLYALAMETDEGQFRVKYAAGKDARLLQGAVFQQGDGFLGQAALGKEPRHWQAVSKDPRALFFTQLGLEMPEYLSCYPVRINKCKRALMFTAGTGRNSLESGSGHQEKMIASLLGISERGEELLRQAQLGKEGTLWLKEAAALLPQSRSLHELGEQILNVVMGLPFYPSSVLVYFQDKGYPANTYFARGWTPESEAYYIQELEARYSPQSFLSSAIFHETAMGFLLLECPLMSGNEFRGVLSVGFRQREEAELWMTLLETVAALAGTSISLIEKDARYLKQSEVFLRNLRQFLQNNHSLLQNLSLDVSDMACTFARFLGLSEAESEQVKLAGLLAPFRTELVAEYGFFKPELMVLKQVDQMPAYHSGMEKPVLPLVVQVLALVLHHIGGQAEPEQLEGSPQKWIDPSRFRLDSAVTAVVGDQLLSSFQSFLRSHADSPPKKRVITGKRLLDSAALTLPKEEWGISPREEEVLELIVHGKTNKEIASALFISEHTVKNHLSRIFTKMNVTDRSQIIALVYKRILNSERIEI